MLLIAGLVSACGGGDGGGEVDTAEPDPIACCSTQTILVWDEVIGANGYRIYYRSSAGSYLQNLGEGLDAGSSTTYSVAGLVSGATYCFAATAYGADGGESDFSSEACQTIVE